jgi:hypothetical protein
VARDTMPPTTACPLTDSITVMQISDVRIASAAITGVE